MSADTNAIDTIKATCTMLGLPCVIDDLGLTIAGEHFDTPGAALLHLEQVQEEVAFRIAQEFDESEAQALDREVRGVIRKAARVEVDPSKEAFDRLNRQLGIG